MQRFLFRLATAAVVVFLSACGTGEAISPSQALAEVQEARERMAFSHVVWDVTLASGPLQGPFIIEVWRQGPERLRIEVLEAPTPAFRGLVLMRDRERAWLYDPGRYRVEWGAPDQARLPLLQDTLEEVDLLLRTVEQAQVVSTSRERLATGEATRVELRYPDGAQVTLWLAHPPVPAAQAQQAGSDTSSLLLAGIAYHDATADADAATLTARTLEEVPDLPRALFSFEPPPQVQQVHLEDRSPEPLSLAEAEQKAGFSLLLPAALPSGTALAAIYQLDGVVALAYTGTLTFTLTQGPGLDLILPPDRSRTVSLRATQGVLSASPSGEVTLLWHEEGITRSLAGPLSEVDALRLAESLR
jgi:outer membrane lipoprotein-sorting protein